MNRLICSDIFTPMLQQSEMELSLHTYLNYEYIIQNNINMTPVFSWDFKKQNAMEVQLCIHTLENHEL